MASRIDGTAETMAHTVIHAVIVRMQGVADQTGKSIGLIYDLSADRIRFVDTDSAGFDRSEIFHIVTPRPGLRGIQAGEPLSPLVAATS
jgi:hypothetical protein